MQGAFQEVADALVARRRLDEQIVAQSRTVSAQRRLARTARQRYDNGIAIYLEVLPERFRGKGSCRGAKRSWVKPLRDV